MTRHVVVTDVRIDGSSANGLATAIIRDLPTAPKGSIVISTDAASFQVGNTSIIPAGVVDGTTSMDRYFSRLFDNGLWPVLHQTAYSSPLCPDDVLSEMFASSSASIGSLNCLLQHCDRFSPSQEIEKEVNGQRYRDALASIPDGSSVHFHGFGLVSAMSQFSKLLASKKCSVTIHLHESVPKPNSNSKIASDFFGDLAMPKLEGVSQYQVYTHTDLFRRNILADPNLQDVDVRTYSLGTNLSGLEENWIKNRSISASQLITSYRELTDSQKNLINKLEESRLENKTVFINIDRCDPIKGTITAIRSAHRFLQSALIDFNNDISRLHSTFHFVFLLSHLDSPKKSEHDLMGIYREVCNKELGKLIRAFPNSVSVADPIRHTILPWLLDGANLFSCSTADGLHLAGMESIFINHLAKQPVATIIGSGSGFASQIQPSQHKSLIIAESGSEQSYVKAFQMVHSMRCSEPDELRESNIRFTNEVIYARNANMIVPR